MIRKNMTQKDAALLVRRVTARKLLACEAIDMLKNQHSEEVKAALRKMAQDERDEEAELLEPTLSIEEVADMLRDHQKVMEELGCRMVDAGGKGAEERG